MAVVHKIEDLPKAGDVVERVQVNAEADMRDADIHFVGGGHVVVHLASEALGGPPATHAGPVLAAPAKTRG